MKKLEITKKYYYGEIEEIKTIYKIIGVRKDRLLLELLEIVGTKEFYVERENPSYKIYYDSRIGNFIKIDGENIVIDEYLKELFNNLYFKEK